MAVSPTVILSELANSATVVTLSEAILTTAISEYVSVPTNSPTTFVPSESMISI